MPRAKVLGNYLYVCTVLLNYWCHAVFRVLIAKVCHGIYISIRRVFRVLIAKVCHGIYISIRRGMALPLVVFTRDVEFKDDGNITFSQDTVVVTKLSNWQDSSCL